MRFKVSVCLRGSIVGKVTTSGRAKPSIAPSPSSASSAVTGGGSALFIVFPPIPPCWHRPSTHFLNLQHRLLPTFLDDLRQLLVAGNHSENTIVAPRHQKRDYLEVVPGPLRRLLMK